VPKPVESGRIGGAPLRDVELLDWCTKLLRDLLAPAKVPASV
jgi:transcription-repair coupling factor (superfamily II helicase)